VTSTAMIVALVGVLASLFLAVRSWRSHGLSVSAGVRMGLIWAVIIAVTAFVLGRLVG
jgi:hypothetical protein